MKNRIGKSITIFIALMMTSAFIVTVEAQTDREIPQQFHEEYQEIERMINEAESLDDLRATQDRVNQLLNDYRDHTAVINRAIHPETVGGRFEELRVKFMAMQSKIRTIQQQDRSLDRLRSELSQTRSRLDQSDDHVAWLLSRVNELEQRVLTAEEGTGEELSAALRERDRFVTELLTDLLERYESVDASAQQEMTAIFERLDDSPVDLLRTILGEHLMYAQQATGLTTTNLLNMKAQHTYFNDWWQRFGSSLTQTFEPGNAAQAQSEISERVSSWSAAIDQQLWSSISDAYAQQGFDLPSFGSSQEFYDAQASYIRDQAETARGQNNEEDLEHFRSYSDFWNQSVKSEWGEALTASAVLSHSQIANIDRLLADWSQAAVPARTGNLMTILFLISLAVNIGLIVALFRRDSTRDPEPT